MRWGACVALYLVAVGYSLPSHAQEISGLPDREQQYVSAFLELLDRWQQHDTVFTREAFDQDFEGRFKAFQARKQNDDVEEAISSDFVFANAKRMPDKVVSELPLTPGARMMLAASVADAAEQLAAAGVEPTPESLQNALPFSLYSTLGSAQVDAQESGKTAIDTTSVRRGGIWFFSMGWPFCCAGNPN